MDSDDRLLRFLAEMVHPVVRADEEEARELVELTNSHLRRDGWCLTETGQISGRPVYAPAEVTSARLPTVPATVNVFESGYVDRQIKRMNSAIDTDPELAIGSAKEWLETLCKTVLDEKGLPLPDELPGLLRQALDVLAIEPPKVADPGRAAAAMRRLLGNLSGLGQSIAEVRNACGTGHGQRAGTGDLDPLLARVVVGAAITLGTFIVERHRVAAIPPVVSPPPSDDEIPF